MSDEQPDLLGLMQKAFDSIPSDYSRERAELVNQLAADNGAMGRKIAMLIRQVETLTKERDAAYAAGRADAAKALRHAGAQSPWPIVHAFAEVQRAKDGDLVMPIADRIIDWAAEVAERGEVPA